VNIYQKLNDVKVFLFDVDGVFTDSGMLATEEGQLLRTMHTRDGLAVKLALNNGYQVGIITKGNSQGVADRFRGLGVEHIYMFMADKMDSYNDLKAKLQFSDNQVLYMGDDLSDLNLLRTVGVSACPYDACPEVLEEANYISSLEGGYGCVRQIIEKVMRLHGTW
jgi:3-deoxy-D-manno-octulosonate 8-phosphate phosphatase (KDO 8-P phosphatase)